MEVRHECGKDYDDRAIIFYHAPSKAWYMELGFDSCVIQYCPFCGEKLEPDEEEA